MNSPGSLTLEGLRLRYARHERAATSAFFAAGYFEIEAAPEMPRGFSVEWA